jgi:mannose-6-phosphate isomerase-like protein (cupin superfamily)
MAAPAPFVIPPGGGEAIRSPLAGPMWLKARAETTGGTFSLLENVVPPGAGPPRHRHHDADEMYVVLEGSFRFELDDRIEPAPTGAFVFVPRGTPHCFQNVGTTDGRFLVMFTPAGMERYFEAQASMPPGSMDSDEHRSVAAAHAMEVLGPPLAVRHPL